MPTIDESDLTDLQPLTESVGGVQELQLRELYEQILRDEDIIIVIDAIEEPRLKKRLSGWLHVLPSGYPP